MTLDEPRENDTIFEVDDYKIIINTGLSTQFSVINIYYNSFSSFGDFKITTDLIWKDEYHYCDWSKTW